MPLFYTEKGFFRAIQNGDDELVDKYLAKGGKGKWLKLLEPESGGTPLHVAAAHGHDRLVKKFLEEGAAVDEKNYSGFTPIELAMSQQNYDAAEELAKAGADINQMTGDGTLLEVAVAQGFNSGVFMLIERKADLTKGNPVARAIEHRNSDALLALVKAGAPPGDKESVQNIFQSAVEAGNLELLKLMLEKGADVNKPTAAGGLPLEASIYPGDENVFKFLLDKGADVNGQGRDGKTVLHRTVYFDRQDFFRTLMEKNPRLDIKDNDGYTVPEMAERYGRSSMLKILRRDEEKKLQRDVNPVNATKTRMPEANAETWVLMSPSEVARVSVSPVLGRRLTQIFNFEARERLIISENLKTGAENVTPSEKFDTLEEAHIARALKAFRDLGGKVDDDAVFGGKRLDKKPSLGLGS